MARERRCRPLPAPPQLTRPRRALAAAAGCEPRAASCPPWAPLRRNFYIEVPELARMSGEEVEEYRKQLDGVKVRGKDVPKPVRNWNQVGGSEVWGCGGHHV